MLRRSDESALARLEISPKASGSRRFGSSLGGSPGTVTRRSAVGVGLGSGAIGARVKAGRLVARYPGVYALAPARMDPPALAAAAVLAGGPNAVASHTSAAFLWGFVARWQPPPEITLAAGDRRPRGILTHRCPSLKRRDMRRQLGVPATSPARTILDIAPRLTAKQRARLVNNARREGHLHPDSFSDVLARNPSHPGTKLLRPFAEDPTNPTRSPFEDDFLAFIQRVRPADPADQRPRQRPGGRRLLSRAQPDRRARRPGLPHGRARRLSQTGSATPRTSTWPQDRADHQAALDRGPATGKPLVYRRFCRRPGVLGSSYGLLPEL